MAAYNVSCFYLARLAHSARPSYGSVRLGIAECRQACFLPVCTASLYHTPSPTNPFVGHLPQILLSLATHGVEAQGQRTATSL